MALSAAGGRNVLQVPHTADCATCVLGQADPARPTPAAVTAEGGIAAVPVKGACGVAGRPDSVRPWTGTGAGDAGGPRRQVAAARRPDGQQSLPVGAPADRRRQAVQTQDGPSDWRAEALCAQIDPELFFPEQGVSSHDARAVCARCPVAAERLDWALAHHERYGIWGGTTARERLTSREPAGSRDERSGR
jgi:WhiB family transcriptional regulator, redox-sensing transcriptional regulator